MICLVILSGGIQVFSQMGQIVSELISSAETIVDDFAKTVTDISKVITQLKSIRNSAGPSMTTLFTFLPSEVSLPNTINLSYLAIPNPATPDTDSPADSSGDSRNTVQEESNNTLNDLANSVRDGFKKQYPKVTPSTDRGIIQPSTGDGSCVVEQIKRDLTNWNLPSDETVAKQIVDTIRGNSDLTVGLFGFQHGIHYVNANQSIVWVCTYGTIETMPASGSQNSVNAIFYAFGAGLQISSRIDVGG
jgi:hypothetical protein